MALTTHLSSYVGGTVQMRGFFCYRSKGVQIIAGNKEKLQAFVNGTDRYEVDLYRDGCTTWRGLPSSTKKPSSVPPPNPDERDK